MIPYLILHIEAQPLAIPFELRADDGFNPRLRSRLGEDLLHLVSVDVVGLAAKKL